MESTLHKEKVKETLKELKEKGYKTINLQNKSPDGIAVKGDKIYAVEVLGMDWKPGKGWKKKFTVINKKRIYDMFDDIIIRTFKHPKRH